MSKQLPLSSILSSLKSLADANPLTIDNTVLMKLADSGIVSTVLHQTHEAISIGIEGRITKHSTPLLQTLIHDMIEASNVSISHLIIMLGTDATVDFSFYKTVTDFLTRQDIGSIQFVSSVDCSCVKRGVDFIRTFSQNANVHQWVDDSLPIDDILSRYIIPTTASTS